MMNWSRSSRPSVVTMGGLDAPFTWRITFPFPASCDIFLQCNAAREATSQGKIRVQRAPHITHLDKGFRRVARSVRKEWSSSWLPAVRRAVEWSRLQASERVE